MPFLEAVRTFPSAVNLHLSPATMVGVKGKTRLKPPSGVSLKIPDWVGLSAQTNSSHPVCPALVRSMRTIGPPPPVATVPKVTSEYCFWGGAMLHTPEAL
jgi:hypothetical protein